MALFGAEGRGAVPLPRAQERLADFIAQVVASLDTVPITERLEPRMGKDLQFVPVNGTLMGFLADGALRAAFGGL